MSKLLKIDDLLRGDHYYLRNDDECYYHIEYMSRAGYQHSAANDLIHNFKKPTKYKGQFAWKYKLCAIDQIATMFQQSLHGFVNLDEVTLVPIPPSKIKTDPEYDDRVLQLIHKWTEGSNPDIRELITMQQTMTASHDRSDRLSPEKLKRFLEINAQQMQTVPSKVILIDDVLTTGAHFIACKDLLLENCPGISVIGIFIARTIWSSAADDFN